MNINIYIYIPRPSPAPLSGSACRRGSSDPTYSADETHAAPMSNPKNHHAAPLVTYSAAGQLYSHWQCM